MFFWPRAEFWRVWARAAFVVALAVWFLLAHAPAHAAGRHHHHARHHHRLARAFASPAVVAGGGDAVSIAMRYVGSGNPTGSRRAWCGDFLNMTERLAGRPGLVSGGLASAWRTYGRASGPVRGAIAIMRGHVARVVAVSGDRVELVSGNWASRVSLHVARIRDVVAFRVP